MATVRDKFIASIEETYKQAIEIIKKKNADYSTETNPYRNFEYAQYVDVSVERAILVRISDKLARISNLLGKKEPEVKDERLEDTLLDMLNYTAILKSYIESKHLQNPDR
jgi:hypothetical protein